MVLCSHATAAALSMTSIAQMPWTTKLEHELRGSREGAFEEMVRLVSRDGEKFRVPKYAILLSNLISCKVLYQPGEPFYHLPNINGNILSLVLEFCIYHTMKRPANHEITRAAFVEIEKPMTKGPHLRRYVEKQDAKFINLRTQEEMLHLYYASHYLDIKPLCEIVMAHVACKYIKASQGSHSTNRAVQFREAYGVGTIMDQKMKKEKHLMKHNDHGKYHDPFADVQRQEWHAENMWLVDVLLPDEDITSVPMLDGESQNNGPQEKKLIRLTLNTIENIKVIVTDNIIRHRLSDIFQEFDSDGNAVIDVEEMTMLLNLIQNRGQINSKYRFTDTEVKSILNAFDKNNDGVVDETEFIDWCIDGLMKQPHERHLYRKRSTFAHKLDTFLTAIERIVAEDHYQGGHGYKSATKQSSINPYHRDIELAPVGASGHESNSLEERKTTSNGSGSSVASSSEVDSGDDAEELSDITSEDSDGEENVINSRIYAMSETSTMSVMSAEEEDGTAPTTTSSKEREKEMHRSFGGAFADRGGTRNKFNKPKSTSKSRTRTRSNEQGTSRFGDEFGNTDLELNPSDAQKYAQWKKEMSRHTELKEDTPNLATSTDVSSNSSSSNSSRNSTWFRIWRQFPECINE